MKQYRGPLWCMVLVVLAVLASSCVRFDVAVLAHDSYGGRDNGTVGSQKAQEYLVARLEQLGAGPVAGQTSLTQSVPGGTNIIAMIDGSDRSDEYVIIGAHYDHVGDHCDAGEPGDTICNGATDNAAGVAAVLDIARRLSEGSTPSRSVILAFWDREEDGLIGASHYVQHPLVPLADTVAYLNFDILGSNLLPSLSSMSFAVGAETGGAALVAATADAIAAQPPDSALVLDTRQLSSVFGLGRSDYAVFAAQQIPTVFFTDSTGPCYHTVDDELDVVDFDKLEAQITIASALAQRLVDGSVTPGFTAGAPTATFDDALQLHDLVQTGLDDLDRFNATDQAFLTQFAQLLDGIVGEGAGSFGDDDVATVLSNAAALVSLLTSGECDGFLGETTQ